MTKKKKIIIAVLFSLFFVAVLVFLYVRNVEKKKMVIVLPVVNESTESTDSAFEDLDGTEPLEENKENAVSDPMNFASKFMGRYDMYVSKTAILNMTDVLVPMEVLVKVNVSNGVRDYEVLASQNNSFAVGGSLGFEPVINSETLMISTVSDDKNTISFSDEFPDFKFPDSLKNRDKIAFFCEVDDCSDGKFAWALVF